MRRLWRDRGGAALVEFALVLPVMLLMGMGLCEMAYQAYMQAILTGAVQKAGRDSTVESANTTTIDNAVLQAVKNINGNAAFVSGYPTRKSYASFGYISPESFVDSNGNGVRDPGECFTDVNGNGIWDADPGVSGNGGAGDTVLYTVSITYTRLFPLGLWLGWGKTATLSASTILKNQPWAMQATTAAATVCT
ncbi:TadE/TadG family type IV pilus assembly protein [Novosphingobium humi]|uniref:Pilus assembly protein n=1 Tax=Novosphingobium humi TaxID=2282397 RepID=A0ABY7TW69_9SPHN|nr:TadE family protein [Novosphingobium humi]WCT77479.1 pilus assembly protein [Novosphingobium humi]WJS98992.1 pilus assembly protein [Novosphingobium humi]